MKDKQSENRVPAKNGGYLIPLKKGQTANKNGRPKGTRNWSTLIREYGDKGVSVLSNGKTIKELRRNVVAQKLWEKAMSGDSRHITIIMDREDGLPQEQQVYDYSKLSKDEKLILDKLLDKIIVK